MKLSKLRNGLGKVEDHLLRVSDMLATNHEFTQLIEEKLALDVKAARGDAWISAKAAQELADPLADKNGAFDEELTFSPRQLWAERVIALQRQISETQAECEKIKSELFSNELTPRQKRKKTDREDAAKAILSSGMDEVAQKLAERGADISMPNSQERAKSLQDDDPRERAQSIYFQIETMLAEAAQETAMLVKELESPRRAR